MLTGNSKEQFQWHTFNMNRAKVGNRSFAKTLGMIKFRQRKWGIDFVSNFVTTKLFVVNVSQLDRPVYCFEDFSLIIMVDETN